MVTRKVLSKEEWSAKKAQFNSLTPEQKYKRFAFLYGEFFACNMHRKVKKYEHTL